MDRCSNSGGRAVWEEKGAEEKQSQEKESVERRSMYAKRSKSRETLCFGNVLRPREGQKSGFAKTAERSHLAGWEIKTPMWRETHFEVKMFKTLQLRTAFGSCAVGCGAKRFWNLTGWKSERGFGAKRILKSKSYNTSVSEHFWKLRRWKSARGGGAKHRKPKWKSIHIRCAFGSWAVEKLRRWGAKHISPHVRATFGCFKRDCSWPAQWILHLQKSEPNVWLLQPLRKQWQASDFLKRICKDACVAWQAQ